MDFLYERIFLAVFSCHWKSIYWPWRWSASLGEVSYVSNDNKNNNDKAKYWLKPRKAESWKLSCYSRAFRLLQQGLLHSECAFWELYFSQMLLNCSMRLFLEASVEIALTFSLIATLLKVMDKSHFHLKSSPSQWIIQHGFYLTFVRMILRRRYSDHEVRANGWIQSLDPAPSLLAQRFLSDARSTPGSVDAALLVWQPPLPNTREIHCRHKDRITAMERKRE